MIGYEVTGSGTVDIEYALDAAGTIVQVQAAAPWSRTLTLRGASALALVRARGTTGGSVSCRLTVDGVEVASDTAAAQQTASCAASG
ncbi:MmpS family transport accessory protein [Motilibacter aurantiacus]|uniref:MmpS family transport accessory protein n=1 Tax=Motilibacter aurantiacus TaxID=2714955 RepID=UPI001408A29A|nr:hypothetical protein [Motilibacter aurantiacus]